MLIDDLAPGLSETPLRQSGWSSMDGFSAWNPAVSFQSRPGPLKSDQFGGHPKRAM